MAIPRFSPPFTLPELFTFALNAPRYSKAQGIITSFEKEFSKFQGGGYTIAVPSARVGLYLILQAFSQPEKDEVILPSFTYAAVPATIHAAGMKPVFADIEPGAVFLSSQSVKDRITARTRALIPTHLFGQPAELDQIISIARANNILVIEDCAQACGALLHGQRVGTFGDIAYFSFYVTKNITAFGGGALFTRDQTRAQAIRDQIDSVSSLANTKLFKELCMGSLMDIVTWNPIFTLTLYPLTKILKPKGIDLIHKLGLEPITLTQGISPSARSSWLSPWQAGILLHQLKHLDERSRSRNAIGSFLDRELSALKSIRIPRRAHDNFSVFLNYPVFSENRDRLALTLLQHGVDTANGYLYSCAQRPEFHQYKRACPESDNIERTILHLPIHRRMNETRAKQLVAILKKIDHE